MIVCAALDGYGPGCFVKKQQRKSETALIHTTKMDSFLNFTNLCLNAELHHFIAMSCFKSVTVPLP